MKAFPTPVDVSEHILSDIDNIQHLTFCLAFKYGNHFFSNYDYSRKELVIYTPKGTLTIPATSYKKSNPYIVYDSFKDIMSDVQKQHLFYTMMIKTFVALVLHEVYHGEEVIL